MEADFGAEGLDPRWDAVRGGAARSAAVASSLFPTDVQLNGLRTRSEWEAQEDGWEGEETWEEEKDELQDSGRSRRAGPKDLGGGGRRPGIMPRPGAPTTTQRPTNGTAGTARHERGAGAGGRRVGRRKRKGRTYAGGITAFLRTVLHWPADSVALGSRQALGLPPLCAPQRSFSTSEAYYASIDELAVEEARAALHQALTGRGRGGEEERGAGKEQRLALQLELADVSPFESSELRTVVFKLLSPTLREKRVREATLPGWVLSLRAPSLPASPTVAAPLGFAGKRRRGSEGLSSWTTTSTSTRCAPERRPPAVLGSVLKRVLDSEEVCLSVVVPVGLLERQALEKGGRWTAIALSSVIIQQRQCATAYERPNVPFMHRLLGGQTARHTKFESSGDDATSSSSLASSLSSSSSASSAAGSDSDSDSECSSSAAEEGYVSDSDSSVEGSAGVDKSAGAPSAARSLDRAQGEAMARCLAACEGSVELVQGPPGCGKTYWMSALVSHLLSSTSTAHHHHHHHHHAHHHHDHHPLRLLVAAPCNKAVAVALAACVEASPEHADSFALFGVEEALTVCASGADDAKPDDLLDRKHSGGLLKGSAPCDAPPTSASSLISDAFVYSKATAMARKMVEAGERLCGVVDDDDGGDSSLCSEEDVSRLVRVSHTERCAQTCDAVSSALLVASRCGVVLRDAAHLAADESEAALVTVAEEVRGTREWWVTAVASWPCCLRDSVRRVSAAGRRVQSVGRALMTGLAADAPRRDRWAEALLSTASVVFCTLGSAGGGLLRRARHVDILIVDEAAQALEGDLVLAFTARPRRVVLVGDPAQLPATLLSLEASRTQRARSAMARLMEAGDHVSLLDTQYRMHPDIAAFPASAFYNGALRTSAANAARACAFSAVPARYCLVDVVGREVREPSIANRAEAEAAAAIVVRLGAGLDLVVSRQVQVICFYKAQVAAVRRALRCAGVTAMCAVATVDSFQGSEADVCIVSMGRCNDGGRVGFVKDKQRLNVALTRARHACYVLASTKTLTQSDSKELQSLVKDAASRSCLLPVEQLLATLG